MLLTRPACPSLCDHVEMLWHYDGDSAYSRMERVLPSGRFQLNIDLSTCSGFLIGLRSRYVDISPAAIRAAMGVVFRPGGALAFFHEPAGDFHDRVVSLDDLWLPRRMNALRGTLRSASSPERQLDALEMTLLRGLASRPMHPSVLLALHRLPRASGTWTVAEMSQDTGLSRRRFSQLFREQVGMPPKPYCRLMRFRQVATQIRAGRDLDLRELALAGGYFDQAHLSREFREFSGLSPVAFLEAESPSVNHVRID